MSKRILDVCLSTTALALTAPLWILIPLLVWLEDGHPVILRQERVGRGGKTFQIHKFRTMRRSAEISWVVEDRDLDPRITGVGRILRATGMDELPQLLNVLKGEMSFVGPRALPLRIEDHEKIRYRTIEDVRGYELRSRVKPGMTGIAQIFAPKSIPRRMKFRYDCLYIKRWNLALDIKLVALSMWVSLSGGWERRSNKV